MHATPNFSFDYSLTPPSLPPSLPLPLPPFFTRLYAEAPEERLARLAKAEEEEKEKGLGGEDEFGLGGGFETVRFEGGREGGREGGI
jgi:hypothetical protein